ncbi:acriflavin resistance protein [Bacterioplanes sanyensis]|uniref:Acriflavin resistance protein n=1 Tax=Bacterioplanes sanyensis TaxID=1249553 RepID=A0A222FIV0_9GAMM|nr:efflux RND transporter permease subunit [Bacterioplanes sanyensis]ASP38700.1 acriflavin resistance protein [Bacterioplanes sanyensis]
MMRFIIEHPTAANLLMLLALVLGLNQLGSLKRETFPHIESYEMQASVTYPGAAVETIANAVCRPLEDSATDVLNLQEMRCDARSGRALLTLTMAPDGDFTAFQADVRSAIDGIDDLPEQAEEPVVSELGQTQPVVSLALTSAQLQRWQLKDLAEHLKLQLLQQSDAARIDIDGFGQRQWRISLLPEQLRRYQLSLQQVSQLIAQNNIRIPAGQLQGQRQVFDVQVDHESRTLAQLQQLILLSPSDGDQIRLMDIARVEKVFEPLESRILFDGTPAALLHIKKNTGQDSLDILAQVNAFMAQQQQRLPDSIELHLTQDQTSIIVDRLNMLMNNAWQGLLLVFVTLLLFFNLRYTFWVVMGLPVSFLGGLFVLGWFDISINMMSMVALLLALGILMDDAIVISESIAEQLKSGNSDHQSISQAVIAGVQRVGRGVLSSFATTVLIFGSMIGLQGDLGQVLRVVPMVLLIVVCVSLLEAFFILPSHLFHSVAGEAKLDRTARLRAWVQDHFERWQKKLGNGVHWAIRWRYAVLGSTLALFMLSVSLLVSGVLKFSALPELDGDVLQARLLLPAGATLAQTQQQVDQLQQALNKASNELEPGLIEHQTVTFGFNADAYESGPHMATVSLDLLSAEQRQTSIDELISAWQAQLPALPWVSSLIFTEPALGPAGRAIELGFSGLPVAQLDQVAEQTRQWLGGFYGVYNLFDDSRPGIAQLNVTLKAEAQRQGLDQRWLANELYAAFYGVKVNEQYTELDDIEVRIALDRAWVKNQDQLALYPVRLPTGDTVALEAIADIEWQQGVQRLQRVDRQTTVTVYGSVNGLQANSKEVIQAFQAQLWPQLQQQYPALRLQLEGELANSAETQQSLKQGFILGLLGVFILLSLQFRSYSEPLIVMLAIPLALIGVVFGHLVMGYNLAMPSMIGFVSLAGIVVNNAILIVEFVKQHVAQGHALADAAQLASEQRLRAMLLTTSTTVAGMLPLLLETSLQAQVLIPLVISVAFGLLASSVLVLFVIPCLFACLQDWRR